MWKEEIKVFYEDKTQYKKLCEECSDVFAKFTEIPAKRDIKRHIELINSSNLHQSQDSTGLARLNRLK